jgi:hypothetical protein
VLKKNLHVKLIPTPLFAELTRRRKKYRATHCNLKSWRVIFNNRLSIYDITSFVMHQEISSEDMLRS